jgi:hypothetical protein
MWISSDGINFTKITNDYFHGNDKAKWCGFAIGHIETNKNIIQYFVSYEKKHGDPSLDNTSAIVALIYVK